VPDDLRQRVEKDVAKGVRSLKSVAKFEPYIAGNELTIADCAAFVHLPLVTLVTKTFLGRDFLEDIPQIKPYLKMLGERPAFARVNEDRRAATAAAKK
jgi:glutathione S-transferase